MAGAEQLEITCRKPFEQRHMRMNEIQVRAHPNADQPRALKVEVVLDPDFRIEHPHHARDKQHDDEPCPDARGIDALRSGGASFR